MRYREGRREGLRKIEGNEIQKEREEGERERKIRGERGIERDRVE
jgi:hypothetical protein